MLLNRKNTTQCPWSGLKPGPLVPEANALTIIPPRPYGGRGVPNKYGFKIIILKNHVYLESNFFPTASFFSEDFPLPDFESQEEKTYLVCPIR